MTWWASWMPRRLSTSRCPPLAAELVYAAGAPALGGTPGDAVKSTEGRTSAAVVTAVVSRGERTGPTLNRHNRHGGPMPRATAAGLGAALLVAVLGCGGSPSPSPRAARPVPLSTATATPTAATTLAAQHARTAQRQSAGSRHFRWRTTHVTAKSLGNSWHSGCPIGPHRLRALHMTVWGFDHTTPPGTMIVRKRAVPAYVSAFRAMYRGHFPIRRMRPVSV